MADSPSGEEKTEAATPKRKEEARKEGQVPKSLEVNTVLMLLAGTLVLYFYGTSVVENLMGVMTYYFQEINMNSLSIITVYNLMLLMTKQCFMVILPILIVLVLMAIGVNVMQFGFLFTTQPLVPKPDRLDIFNNAGRFFSKEALGNLVKSIFKIFVLGYIGYIAMRKEFYILLPMAISEPCQFIPTVGMSSFRVIMKMMIALIIMAAVDFGFQRWLYEDKLKMTKYELKQEFEETEGDPLVRSRIRRKQQEIALSRMMAEVPKAEVVVTNPTMLAIALRYKRGEDAAPVVVAKGQRKMAQRIREIAEQNNVPIVEDKPLARALFKVAVIDMSIPEDFYKAVARILAQLEFLDKRRREREQIFGKPWENKQTAEVYSDFY